MRYIYREELFINGAKVDATTKDWESDSRDDYEKIKGLWTELAENSHYHFYETIGVGGIELIYRHTIGDKSVIFNRTLNVYNKY